jgi:hypothetical protein
MGSFEFELFLAFFLWFAAFRAICGYVIFPSSR